MEKIANIFLILFTAVLLQSCEEDQFESSLEYVSFGKSTYSTGVDVDGSTTLDVFVYTSKIVKSDVTFKVSVDPSSNAAAGSYTVPASVTVLSGTNKGTLKIELSDVDLGIGVNRLLLNFDDVTPGYGNGAGTKVEYVQNCNEVTATLTFTFDDYPEEAGWNIKDALGGIVVSKAYGAYSGKSSSSESIKLCAGRSYTFTMLDKFGDGMFDGANTGSYNLTIGGIVKANGSGDFGGSESTAFSTK